MQNLNINIESDNCFYLWLYKINKEGGFLIKNLFKIALIKNFYGVPIKYFENSEQKCYFHINKVIVDSCATINANLWQLEKKNKINKKNILLI